MRVLTLCAAAALLGACASGDSPASQGLSQAFSTEAAFTHAVSDICLAAELSGRPPSAFAAEPRAMSVQGDRAPPIPGKAWFVGSGVYVVEVNEPAGGCYVRADRGDGTALRALAVQLATAAVPDLTQGRSGRVQNGAVLRTTWCSAARPEFFMLVSSRTPQASAGPAIQISFGRDDQPNPHCRSNGPGDGMDRTY